uniref:Putative LOC100748423 [Bombus impatiens] n=1 Tax=Lepeophtheirus salmonis TaxID=72036 RepID=A0A0K2V387_LEPSM
MNFRVIAREKGYKSRQSSSDIILHIRDQNDNSPEFSQDPYSVNLLENIGPGEIVATVSARDNDSNSFGTQGIRYTGISGPLADKLYLNPLSGDITLLEFPSPFDREKSEFHYFSVEARDLGGNGNRNTAELIIQVKDVNDNAPVFDQSSYEAYIMENSPRFISPLIVKAKDIDTNKNGLVRYRIIRGENFTIDPEDGRINPSGRLDFESLHSRFGSSRPINLTVRAYDKGIDAKHSDVNVTIFVMDENDHRPIFKRSLYQVTVPEDIKGGTNIIQVKATDGDGTSPNNKLAYRISSGAKDKFVIDADSGVISISQGANLDPDLTYPYKTINYHLEVKAIDGGLGRDKLTGSTNVNITVKDINNKAPRFVYESPSNSISVLENVNIGHFLTQIKASDLDQNAEIIFSIDASKCSAHDEFGNYVDYDENVFEIDSKSGDLRVKGKLDREMVSIFKICIVVKDIFAIKEDDGSNGQKDIMYLNIQIEDVNDNSPIFDKSHFSTTITENLPKLSQVIEVNAKDLDANRSITYSFNSLQSKREARELLKYLHIDQKTGLIIVKELIDAEKIQWFNFSILATDNGYPSKSSIALVSVNILDVNDNSPYFEKPTLQNLTVREDAPIGTVIAKILAKDDDVSTEFGKITYFLDSNSAIGKFRIDPETGELSISEELNREENDNFNLIIQAYDNYQFGFTTGDSRHAFIQIYIRISDVNDEIPMFQEVPEQCTLITEFHELSEDILTVRAYDMDDHNTLNGKLNFDIKSGNDLDLFRLESFQNFAKIYPNKPLKGHYGNYSLIVKVSDRGQPPNTNEASYNICVQDFNDNAPVFLHPPRNFTIRIPENLTIGSEVIHVEASDTDIGSNGAVRYRLRNDPLGNYESFSINSTSGVIKLRRSLDRERQKIYEIRVEAFDLGVPTSLQSDLDLKIFVCNINDHEPQFLVNEFHANFTEGKPPGKERVLLIDTVDRDDDDDYGSSSSSKGVCYFIVGGENKTLFDLHPTQHELIINKVLDREESQEHEIIIKATEECFNIPEEVDFFDSDDDTLLLVKIRVTDINDNPPKFDKKVFTGGIASDRDFGTTFMSISAHDMDINSKLTYSISGEIVHSKGSEGMKNIQKPEFTINPKSGEIMVNFDVQKGMKGYFKFNVEVRDEKNNEAGHIDVAKVLVYLLRPDQRVRFVIRSRPAEIRQRIREFRDMLHKVSGAVVNIDALLVHKDPDGILDQTKTDVFLHLVNPRDNIVLDVEKVLKLIDYKTEELDPVFKDFNVLYTDSVEPKFLYRKSSFASEQNVIFWLIGLLGIASLLLFLVICLCLKQKQKFRRRLRAATTSVGGIASSIHTDSSPISTKNKEAVPNTNLHASEGSNPIWLASMGYDNYTYEDEEECNKQQRQENSLDANVLNEEFESSTLRMAQKTVSPHYSETSSGLGSGSSGRLKNTLFGIASSGSTTSSTFRNRNLSIAALFPSQMPPVEKLNNPLVNFGVTTYDDDHIPRTEL